MQLQFEFANKSEIFYIDLQVKSEKSLGRPDKILFFYSFIDRILKV